MSRSRTPIYEDLLRGPILKTTTNASGSGWVVVGNAGGGPTTARIIQLVNRTGVDLEFAYGAIGATSPTGETYELPANCADDFPGMTDSRELFVRRLDLSASQVTFKAKTLK